MLENTCVVLAIPVQEILFCILIPITSEFRIGAQLCQWLVFTFREVSKYWKGQALTPGCNG